MVDREPAHESKEIELKLEFDPADVARIVSHPVLEASGRAPETRELISIYYDTDEGALRKAGVFLRVRLADGRYVQTIKSARSEAEILERSEWEHEVQGHEPNLEAAEGTALAPLLTPKLRAALRPRFHTRFWRKTYHVAQNGTEVEIAVDQGEITAGTRAAAISEIELELKSGRTRELFRLAERLFETVPLKLAVKTKAERGFELLEDGDHAVEKAGDVHVTPDLTSGEAFRVIARSCLRQIAANEPAVCDGRPDALHQMRIGLRRTRAAIALFADMLADQDIDWIKGELRWITQELGPARDLHVFGEEVLEPLRAAHAGDDDLAKIHRDFEERRATAYARAANSVHSERCRKALLGLAAWIETGAWAIEDDAERKALRDRPITEHATQRLSRLRRRIKKKGARLRELSAEERHRLRIRAKRLRYATEFFACTFPGKKNEKLRVKSLSALKDIQDSLGVLNDLAMRQVLLTAGEGEPAVTAFGTIDTDEQTLLDEATEAHKRFAETKAFWKA